MIPPYSQLEVEAYLETRLANWAAGRTPPLPVAWPNRQFTPPPSSTYLRVDHLSAPPVSNDLAGKHRRWGGVMQVSVCSPGGTGRALAVGLAAELEPIFPVVPSRSTENGIEITILQPVGTGPSISQTDRFFVPLTVRYTAQVYTP